MEWLVIILVILAVAWIPKLLPKKIGEPLDELMDRSVVDIFSLKNRAETAIASLDHADPDDPEDEKDNRIRIQNLRRVVERVKHDKQIFRSVVEDLETLDRIETKYPDGWLSAQEGHDPEFDAAEIQWEEVMRRFKDILGKDYQPST